MREAIVPEIERSKQRSNGGGFAKARSFEGREFGGGDQMSPEGALPSYPVRME